MNFLQLLLNFVFVLFTVHDSLANILEKSLKADQFELDDIQSEQIKDADMMIEQSSHHTKQGLGKLFDKIDANQDLFVTNDELLRWIVRYNEETLNNEATFDVKRIDKNNDSLISWEEFMKEYYGNLSLNEDPNNSDHNEIIKYFKDDKYRFMIADADRNEKLSINEFKAFLRPHNHVEMLDYEVFHVLYEYDKDKNEVIDRSEFIEAKYGSHKFTTTQKDYVNKVFDKYDTDHNNQLSKSEMRVWLKPGIDHYAQTEARYLFNVSDINKDGKLSKEEILENFIHWTSSKATNFGADFKDEL